MRVWLTICPPSASVFVDSLRPFFEKPTQPAESNPRPLSIGSGLKAPWNRGFWAHRPGFREWYCDLRRSFADFRFARQITMLRSQSMRVRGNLLEPAASAISIEPGPLSEADLSDFDPTPVRPMCGRIRDYPPKGWKRRAGQFQERRGLPGNPGMLISLTSVPDSSYRKGTGTKLSGPRHRHFNSRPTLGMTGWSSEKGGS